MGFDAPAARKILLVELSASGTPDRAEHAKAYLKSDLAFLGVSAPEIRRAARRFHTAHPRMSHDDLLAVVNELWRARVHELRMLAVDLLELYAHLLTADDAVVIEHLIRESRTWALVDGLSSSVTGMLVDAYPEPMDANRALYTIVLTRMRLDPRTRDYLTRRTAEGLSKREIMRCLQRYFAREVHHILTVKAGPPHPTLT